MKKIIRDLLIHFFRIWKEHIEIEAIEYSKEAQLIIRLEDLFGISGDV